MSDFFIQFVIAGVLFAVIDAIWLAVVAKKFYRDNLGSLMREKPDMIAAVLFYVIFLIGLVVFVINPAVAENSWQMALGLGALLGLVAYATYDLTNLATLKGFKIKVVVVDLIWGTFVTAATSILAYSIFTSIF